MVLPLERDVDQLTECSNQEEVFTMLQWLYINILTLFLKTRNHKVSIYYTIIKKYKSGIIIPLSFLEDTEILWAQEGNFSSVMVTGVTD